MATPGRRSTRRSPRTSSPATRRSTRAGTVERIVLGEPMDAAADGNDDGSRVPAAIAADSAASAQLTLAVQDEAAIRPTEREANRPVTPSAQMSRTRDRTRAKSVLRSSSAAAETGSRSSSRQRKPARIVQMIKQEAEENDHVNDLEQEREDEPTVLTPTRMEESGDDDYTPAVRPGKASAKKSRKGKDAQQPPPQEPPQELPQEPPQEPPEVIEVIEVTEDTEATEVIDITDMNQRAPDGRTRLQEIVDAAIWKSITLGNKLLAIALRRMYMRTQIDDSLAGLLSNVLSQTASPEDAEAFKRVVKEERKKAKRDLATGTITFESALVHENNARNKSPHTSESRSASPARPSTPTPTAAPTTVPVIDLTATPTPISNTRPQQQRINITIRSPHKASTPPLPPLAPPPPSSTPSTMAVTTRRGTRQQQQQAQAQAEAQAEAEAKAQQEQQQQQKQKQKQQPQQEKITSFDYAIQITDDDKPILVPTPTPAPRSPKKLDVPAIEAPSGPPAASTRNSRKRPSSTPEPSSSSRRNGASRNSTVGGGGPKEPPRKKTKLGTGEGRSSSSSALSELSASSRESSTEMPAGATNGLAAGDSFSSAITTGIKIGGSLKRKPEAAQKAKAMAGAKYGMGLPDDEMEEKKRELKRKSYPGYEVHDSDIRDQVRPAKRRPPPPPVDVLGVYTPVMREQMEQSNLGSPASSSIHGDFLIPPPPGAAKPSRAGTPAASGRRTARVKVSPMKKKNAIVAGLGARTGGGGGGGGESPLDESDNVDYCVTCNESGELLCCDGCPRSFHFLCCDPPLEEDAPPTGEWFCYVCENRRNPIPRPPRGLFSLLMHDVSRQNASVYRLPAKIRDYFEGVSEGEAGVYSYDDPVVAKHRTRATGPTAEIEADNFKIKDSKGNFVLCMHCGKTSGGKREMIKCDHCSQYWHLDCLDPPPANAPVRPLANGSRPMWKCPAHAELDTSLPGVHKLRRPKNYRVVDTMLNRGHRNNGDIEIELESSDEESETEVNDDGTIYRVTEKSIKLDFIERVRAMNEAEERKRVWEAELQKARQEAQQQIFDSFYGRTSDEQNAVDALVGLKRDSNMMPVPALHNQRSRRSNGVSNASQPAADQPAAYQPRPARQPNGTNTPKAANTANTELMDASPSRKQRLQGVLSDLIEDVSPAVTDTLLGGDHGQREPRANGASGMGMRTRNSSSALKADSAGLKKGGKTTGSKLNTMDKRALQMLMDMISQRLEDEGGDDE